MNMIQTVNASMTSREIAGMVDSRHDSVKRAIERLSESGVIRSTPMVDFKNTNNVTGQEYVFSGKQGKRDSIVVVAQLSPLFTARLVDRWQELESQVAQISAPTDLSGAPASITHSGITYLPAMATVSGVEYHLTRAGDQTPTKKTAKRTKSAKRPNGPSLLPLLKGLEIGGSVFIDGVKSYSRPINGSRVQAARLGIKIRSRQEGTGVRIWRTA